MAGWVLRLPLTELSILPAAKPSINTIRLYRAGCLKPTLIAPKLKLHSVVVHVEPF